jgi:CheY-like chemotaxis protein
VGNERTILYVDDQPSHRALFLKAFQGKYDIITAASGEEGIEIIKKNKFALIIADHNMPGMTGIDFLEKVQEINPSAEKAILSAYLDDEILNDLNRRVKVSGRLAKPWKLDGMRGYIEKAIASFGAVEIPVAEEGEVPGVPPLSRREEPAGDLATDKPLLTSRELAHAADHIVSELPDARSVRRIFLSFVEPRIKPIFPLIRKPCAPLIKKAQDEALRGNVEALEKTLGKYLQQDGLSAILAAIADPTKKTVH